MEKNVAIIHYNTPELTEAAILSLRKHGGEEYKVYVFDNSDERPFKKRMKGVKVFDNTKGKYIDFDFEMEKYPEKDPKYGCASGCWYGSDKHMMSVQRMWELVPEGFVLMDSDILIKAPIDWMFMEDQCTVGFISHKSYGGHPRLAPMLLWVNVPMCVAGGARFFDPERAWALHQGKSPKNFWDTGAAFLDDIKRLKPQCHGKAITRDQLFSMMEHYGSGSWKKNDIKEQAKWLADHRDLWEPVKKTGKIGLMAMGRHENQYAREWVEHHLSIGFDKIIIFDNNREGEERMMEVLADYVKKGKVVIEEHPEEYGMLQAFKKTYDERGKDFDWLMDMDFDEFLMLPGEEDIHAFMKKFEDKADVVKVNWMMYGDSNLVTNDKRPLLRRFTQPLKGEDGRTETYGENVHVKSLVRCGLKGITYPDPHCPHGAGRYVDASGRPADASPFVQSVNHDGAYIKHFTTKTIEEWMENKVKRGQCDSVANTEGLQKNALALFFGRNEKTKEKVEWLRANGYEVE